MNITLSPEQLVTIRAALQIAEEKWQCKAESLPESSLWSAEAQSARELIDLLEPAEPQQA
jgi:hypothetical protein